MLKQLIQRLLDSRTTPSEAAHSAMPSSSYITQTATAVQAWGQMAQGVAPFDGFVRASARASNTNSNIRVTNDTATVFAQSEGTATGQTQGVFVPVAKGDSWSVYGTNRDNVVVRLVKTVGRGYKALKRFVLQGDGLCLSLSFNCLQKPTSKARNRGLVFRGCRQLRRQSYPQQWTQHGELMLLQKTVMSFLVAEHLSSSCITRLVQVLIMGVPRVSLEDLYRFGRAALCTITSKVRTAPQYSPLFLVSLSNLEKGGLLC